MTNGVSFSLVTGSICMVNFASTLYRGSEYSSNITLNINSTGAKTITIAGNLYYNSSKPCRSADIVIKQYFEMPHTQLFVYNGSTYYLTKALAAEYDDYADSD